jgi:pimeloyl-ACP methyl ester carboxylesterase
VQPNAIGAIRVALQELDGGGHVEPNLERVGFVGHSMGGGLAAGIAAMAAGEGLPPPGAVMCVEPFAPPMMQEDYSRIPTATLMLLLVGEDDRLLANDAAALAIFGGIGHLPAADRDYVTMRSDDHGEPALVADHMAPVASGGPWQMTARRPRLGARIKQDLPQVGAMADSTDALDWYGTWKLFDGLCDAAWYDTNREYALGNTREQKSMGKWSDDTPVTPLVVTDSP